VLLEERHKEVSGEEEEEEDIGDGRKQAGKVEGKRWRDGKEG